jgi:hypothetical protein
MVRSSVFDEPKGGEYMKVKSNLKAGGFPDR